MDRTLIADLVLASHFAIVVFIVGGLVAIWVGAHLAWPWVRNPTFRGLHVAAILFVAAEALVGVACPLTVLEASLRGEAAAQSFIGAWLSRLLYYDFPSWVFTLAYSLFALVVVATWKLVPPRRRV
mgnify:CR=1 FL=1